MKLAAGLLDDSLQKISHLVSHHFPNVDENTRREMGHYIITHSKSQFKRLSSQMIQKLHTKFIIHAK
jgi:hypothetical protein